MLSSPSPSTSLPLPSEYTPYVGAVAYPNHPAVPLAVVGTSTIPQVSATLATASSVTTDEVAIALALTELPIPHIILSDSQTALRNYIKGIATVAALKILLKGPRAHTVMLLWIPAHTSIGCNKIAHQHTRDLISRATFFHAYTRHLRNVSLDPSHVQGHNSTLPPPLQEPTSPGLITDSAGCAHVASLANTLFPTPHSPCVHPPTPIRLPSCGALDTLFHSLCLSARPLPQFPLLLSPGALTWQPRKP